MALRLPVVMVAVLLLTAGCAGVLPQAEPTTTVSPGITEPNTNTNGGDGSVGGVPIGGVSVAPSPDAGRYEFVDSSYVGSTMGPVPPGTIAVTGTGQVTAEPDLAFVSVTVTAQAADAATARSDVASDADRVRSALRDLGLSDGAIRTSYFSVSPRYDYRESGQELIGYVATHAFEIRSAPDQAGVVLDTAIDNGADRVYGVHFGLTEATQRDLRAEALRTAVGDARADADVLASAAGVTITGVHAMSTGGPSYVPYATAAAERADAQTTIDPSPVTVRAAVSIWYTIG